MNSHIKMVRPDAFLLAEIYQPQIYRDYIRLGQMDYLYDKVELYDTLKHIMQGHGSTDNIIPILEGQKDIEHHMLHFLENHDEQRIASKDFAGDARKGLPAMVVSATIGTSPTMIYFAQELGEAGDGNAGQGTETRTTIYDYWGIPSQVRWINNGACDGGKLSPQEKELRNWYQQLLNFTRKSRALTGDFREIHSYNRSNVEWYNDRVFSFVRWKDGERLIVVSNFDSNQSFGFELRLPEELLSTWGMLDGKYALEDMLSNRNEILQVEGDQASLRVDLEPLESLILSIKQ
jgi:glycosidase